MIMERKTRKKLHSTLVHAKFHLVLDRWLSGEGGYIYVNGIVCLVVPTSNMASSVSPWLLYGDGESPPWTPARRTVQSFNGICMVTRFGHIAHHLPPAGPPLPLPSSHNHFASTIFDEEIMNYSFFNVLRTPAVNGPHSSRDSKRGIPDTDCTLFLSYTTRNA